MLQSCMAVRSSWRMLQSGNMACHRIIRFPQRLRTTAEAKLRRLCNTRWGIFNAFPTR
jgi:ABC-type phosphonate transport system ATPase subunit